MQTHQPLHPNIPGNFPQTKKVCEQPLKENNNPHKAIAKEVKDGKKSKVTQGDFSRISCSYVMDGNYLRKHEAYEDTLKTKKKVESKKQNCEKVTGKQLERKQILKLQYLEKMGYLRPDEEEALAEYRKHNKKPSSQKPQESHHNQPKFQTHQRPLHPQNKNTKYPEDNYKINHHPSSFYSPKYNDQKSLSQFFSPNKNHQTYHKQSSYGYIAHY